MMARAMPFLFLFSLGQSFLFAGDGPQNSGRLQLKVISDFEIETVLQIDKKVLLEPTGLFELIKLKQKNAFCSWNLPQMVSNENTLTATSMVRCPETIGALQIGLSQLEPLPKGFSLGVQTLFDHFSLTPEDPQRKIQLKTGPFFFARGFFLGFCKDLVINRPYALSFGGLGVFPWGIWWLGLVAAFSLSCLTTKSKWILTLLSVFTSSSVSYFLLKQEASLKYIPIPRLDLSYLLFLGALASLGWFEKNRIAKALSFVVSFGILILSGFEWTVLLRWLEGNGQVILGEAVTSFTLGIVAVTLLLGLVFHFVLPLKARKGALLFVGRLLLLAFSLYTSLALSLQLL